MTVVPPLTIASDAELAAAAENNVYDMVRTAALFLGGDINVSPRVIRACAWPNSPIFKGAWQARFTPNDVDAGIQETIAWFKMQDAPFFFWWVDHDTQPAHLGERLVAHGLTVFEQNAPAMVADIETLNWNNPRPPDLRLNLVTNLDQLFQWKQVFIGSFGLPEFAGHAWVDATQAVGIGSTPWQLLLGTLNSEPVCCGLLYCGAGVAGLIGLGTLPAFRRQGLGSAMQLERLRIARELGYRYAVLFASEMGHSPYLKIGFKDTGRTISRYLWRAG